jgi:hypothetical protein
MKTKLMNLIAGCIMFVLCISTFTTTSNAAEVWSDDFETGLDGWTFKGYEDDGTGSFIALTEGNFSDEGGNMTVLDSKVNVARHNSTTNVGTWSFDMYVPDDIGAIDVVFMSDGGRPGFDNPGGSGTVFSGNWVAIEAFEDWFGLWQAREGDTEILSFWEIEYYGWHHFDISRTSDSYFRVVQNGTQKASHVNDDVTSSEYLEVWFGNATGWAVDNIVVDDTPPPTPTPTTTPTPTPSPLPWELIVMGGGVAAVVIVVAIVFLRRR